MKTRRQSNSSTSCSSITSTGSSSRLRNRPKSQHDCDLTNGNCSLPFKKRKLSLYEAALDNEKYLTVNITDMLKDPSLSTKYDLQNRLMEHCSSNGTAEHAGLDADNILMESSGEMDSLSEVECAPGNWKVVMQDNLLITVTRVVQQPENNNEICRRRDSSVGERSTGSTLGSNSLDEWLESESVRQKSQWQAHYQFADTEMLKVTSHDTLFQEAELDYNVLANITVQIPNSPTPQQDKLNFINSSYSSASNCSSSKDSLLFKMPLPPAKRPPSRPKKTSSISEDDSVVSAPTSTSSPRNSVGESDASKMQEVEDDALSLIASTVMDVEPAESDLGQPVSELSSQGERGKSFEPTPFPASEEDVRARNNDIMRWVETISPSNLNETTPGQSQIDERSGFMSSPDNQTGSKAKQHTFQRPLPFVFRKMYLCVYHFFDNLQCQKIYCKFSHDPCSVNESAILNLHLAELKEAYAWILDSTLLFVHTFHAFVRRFHQLKQVTDLIDMAKDVMSLDLFDRTPYIKELVLALECSNYSFKHAVETLIRNHGLNHAGLPDILLNLVIESETDLEENWDLVKEILKYRSGEIDYGVVNDIMAKTLLSGTKQMCTNMCEDIFYAEVNNFENIDKTLLTELLTLLINHKLYNHYSKLKAKANIANGFSPAALAHQSSPSDGSSSLVYSDGSTGNGAGAPCNLQSEKRVSSTFGGLQNDTCDASFSTSAQTDTCQTSISSGLQSNVPVNSLNEKREERNLPNSVKNRRCEDRNNCCLPELDSNELCDLLCSLKLGNIHLFVALLNKYKATDKVDSFALNTVVYLMKNQVDKQYFILLKNIELVYQNFMNDRQFKAVIELISYNVLPFLTRKNMYNVAYQVLLRFEDDLDSLVRSREFKKNSQLIRTLADRYLYVSKIYVKNNQYKKALKLLLRKDLKLLKPRSMWKVPCTAESEQYRNRIVLDFLQGVVGESDIKSARCVIHNIIESSLDKQVAEKVWGFYNTIVMLMLNKKETYKMEIVEEFQKRILPSCYKQMKKNILRGLGVVLLRLHAVQEKVSIDFFDICCKEGVYPLYQGTESEVVVATDMIGEEIYLMLLSFFYKVAVNNYTPQELKISIECPEEIYSEPLVLLNSDVGFTEMKKRITTVLIKAFAILIEESKVSNVNRFVVIEEKFVISCVRKLQVSYSAG